MGFVISICWFCQKKNKVGPPFGSIALLSSWMIAWTIYFSLEDPTLTFSEALLGTLDINEFRFGEMVDPRGREANAGTLFLVVMSCIYT